jgi:WD40 repeat protein
VNEFPAGLPAAGVVRVIGPEDAGTGFLVSRGGLIVTCAHVLAGCAPGDYVRVEPHAGRRPLEARVEVLRDPPDVAMLRLAGPVPPGAAVLPLGRPAGDPQEGLRTFGYPQVRPEAGLPGRLAVTGVTADAGYRQLVLRSEEATLGFSGAPVWDPEAGAVVGMVKSIVSRDPGQRLSTTAFGVPADVIRKLHRELRLPTACPYRGLEAFTEEHADYYYGREHATRQLLDSLTARDFVPVVALSGAGKSSLLQAGLAKGLRDGTAAALAQRARCYQRAGSPPHAGLLRSMAQRGIDLPGDLAQAPARELASAIRAAVAAACPAGLIVVVDQYERLYTDCPADERKRFTELLLLLAAGLVKVVIGLRADFYHLALADLGERLADGQVALEPMSEQDLSRAVTEPARKLLRSLEPGLARQIVTDVRDRPGDLPLLQFALTELWERDAEGGILTRETYESLGIPIPDGERLRGAQGALVSRAEQLWEHLSAEDQLRLQRILLGLIAVQPGGNGAASRAGTLRELSRPALLAQWDADDQRLIQQLIDARLLTADRSPAGGKATVEVSHEVLLRAWPRLRDWLDKRADFVQWRARDLAPNLEHWLGSKENPEFLLPRPLLDPALRWLRDYPDELAGPPAEYIRASRWRRTRRRGLAFGTAAILTAGSLAAAVIFFSLRQDAVNQQQDALRQLRVADSSLMIIESQTLSDTDPGLSRLLSVAAWRLNPSSDAWNAMLAATGRPLEGTFTVPGGKPVYSVAFTPDGKTLATESDSGSDSGTVRRWNTASEQQTGKTITVPGSIPDFSVAFTPDGKTLATSSDSGTVRLWDTASGQQTGKTITVPGGSPVDSMAFTRNGTTLATSSGDGTIQLWNTASGQQTGAITVPGGSPVDSMAFTRNGTTLATSSGDGTIQLWNTASGQQTGAITVPDTILVHSMAFTPDGTTLATGSGDGTIQLWDTASGQQTGAITVSSGIPVFSVAFTPDGTTLATGSADGTVRLWDWDIASGQQTGKTITVPDSSPVDPVHPVHPVESMAFTPDGTTLATGSVDGTVRLWDTASGKQTGKTITVPGGSPVDSVAFTPDGTTLATGSGDGTVRLWDTASGKQTGKTITVPDSSPVFSVAFTRGGKTLATRSDDGTVRLWDTASGKQTAAITAGGSLVYSAAFTPDTKTLATSNGEGTARLWNIASGQQTAAITVPGGSPVYSMAFTPDTRTLATSSRGGPVRLWDIASGQQTAAITVPDSSATDSDSVAFAPDGKTLATGSAEGTVRLWDVAYLADPVSDLCSLAGQSLTQAEWRQYAPGLTYQSTCPAKAVSASS